MVLHPYFDKYSRLLLFDTETTGLSFTEDEIIEFAAVTLVRESGEWVIEKKLDRLISLSPGTTLPLDIEQLTGITNAMLQVEGKPKTQVCQEIAALLEGDTLLLAYNAHFDLSFLYHTLRRYGNPAVLKGKDKLDLLTVYRDRHLYPHRLCNAIDCYGLSGEVANTHRAIDDVVATVAVMDAMRRERDDLHHYINLFGYNPKYGIGSKPIGSVTYKPQSYRPVAPLYEL